MSIAVGDVDTLMPYPFCDCQSGKSHVNQQADMAVTKLVEATNGYSLVEAENDIWYDIVRGYGLRRSLFRRKGYFHGTKKQKTSTRRNG